MDRFLWEIVAGVGTITLLIVGLVVRLLWPELIKKIVSGIWSGIRTMWGEIFGYKKSSDVVQNGFVRASYCKLKHEEMDKMIKGFEQAVMSNSVDVKVELRSYRESLDKRFDGMQQLSERILESHGKMKEDIGYIKGSLRIP